MMGKDWDNILLDYMDGFLSQEEIKEVESALEGNKEIKQKYEDLLRLESEIEKDEVEIPSEILGEKFYDFLEREKQTHNSPKKKKEMNYKFISFIGIMIFGMFLLGAYLYNMNEQQKEIQEKQDAQNELLFALLENQSASKRIKGLEVVHKEKLKNKTLVNTLINTLLLDEHPSVRAAAVSALEVYVEIPSVQNAIIKALETEDNPEVQIELINMITRFNNDKSLDALFKMSEDEENMEVIKNQAKIGLTKML